MTRRRATLRSAVVATLALALCACGDAERALRAEGEVTGSVDEPTAVAVAGWPDAETSFCSARVGFGRSQPAGARSTISATTDGGRTWLPRARLDVGAATLTCLSRSEAILSAYPPLNAARPEPLLLRSRDGGRHWRKLRVPRDTSSPPSVLDRDAFVAGRTVTAWYVTRDGAATWHTVAPSSEEPLEALAFPSAEIAYAITSRGDPETATTHLWRSDDAGRTWARISNEIEHLRMHALSASSRTLWVHAQRCEDGCTTVLLRTEDDARHWDLIELPTLPADLRFTSDTMGVASGDGEGLYVTRDGGVTWTWRTPVRG